MADTAPWVPVLTVLAGAASGLGGVWLTLAGAKGRDDRLARTQRADKLHATRAELYLDMMEYLERLDDSLAAARSMDPSEEPLPQRPLAVRVELYGSPELRAAWGDALVAYGLIVQEWLKVRIAQPADPHWHGSPSLDSIRAAEGKVAAAQDVLRSLAQAVD